MHILFYEQAVYEKGTKTIKNLEIFYGYSHVDCMFQY